MKLIVSQLELLKRYVSREFYHIQSDLITNHGWLQIDTSRLWNVPSIRNTILETFGELPEVILFWEGYELLSGRGSEIRGLRRPCFVFADDLHWWNDAMRKAKVEGFAVCNAVLSTYGYAFYRFYPEFRRVKKVIWVPHSASPDFLLSRNDHPENAILLSGAISHHYPLREKLKMLHGEDRYSIAFHAHPGYHCQYDYERDASVGPGYAAKLNRYRAGFTDALKYGYVVAKYFEIPATGALLLGDDSVADQLAELGFVQDRHYLPVSLENMEDKIRQVLDEANHEQLDEIGRKGQELVWEKHKTGDRAVQIDAACRS